MQLYLVQEAFLWHCIGFTRWVRCSCYKEIQTRWACFSEVIFGWERTAPSNSPDGGLQCQGINVSLGLLHLKPHLSWQKPLFWASDVPKSSGDHLQFCDNIVWTSCLVSTCWERQSGRRASTKLLWGETGP